MEAAMNERASNIMKHRDEKLRQIDRTTLHALLNTLTCEVNCQHCKDAPCSRADEKPDSSSASCNSGPGTELRPELESHCDQHHRACAIAKIRRDRIAALEQEENNDLCTLLSNSKSDHSTKDIPSIPKMHIGGNAVPPLNSAPAPFGEVHIPPSGNVRVIFATQPTDAKCTMRGPHSPSNTRRRLSKKGNGMKQTTTPTFTDHSDAMESHPSGVLTESKRGCYSVPNLWDEEIEGKQLTTEGIGNNPFQDNSGTKTEHFAQFVSRRSATGASSSSRVNPFAPCSAPAASGYDWNKTFPFNPPTTEMKSSAAASLFGSPFSTNPPVHAMFSVGSSAPDHAKIGGRKSPGASPSWRKSVPKFGPAEFSLGSHCPDCVCHCSDPSQRRTTGTQGSAQILEPIEEAIARLSVAPAPSHDSGASSQVQPDTKGVPSVADVLTGATLSEKSSAAQSAPNLVGNVSCCGDTINVQSDVTCAQSTMATLNAEEEAEEALSPDSGPMSPSETSIPANPDTETERSSVVASTSSAACDESSSAKSTPS